MRKPHIHLLKTVEPYFSHVQSGHKRFEIRKNDREYVDGDVLILVQYDPETDSYGKYSIQKVTYCLYNEDFNKKGYVTMSISTIYHVISSFVKVMTTYLRNGYTTNIDQNNKTFEAVTGKPLIDLINNFM